jgi:hypothetical protein
VREDFGVTGEMVPGGDEGLLVDGRGDGGVDRARGRELDHGPHRLEGGVTGHRGDLSQLQPGQVDVGEVVHVDAFGGEGRVGDFFTGRTASITFAYFVALRMTPASPITIGRHSSRTCARAMAAAMISGPTPGRVAHADADDRFGAHTVPT